jgi:DNA-binding ferritin-like protein
MRNTFYFIHMVWSTEEVEQFSINVLEAHARDVGGYVFLDKAKELGLRITHTMAYVDNTTAEAIAENGRTSTEMLSELNKKRLLQLTERGVFETNERVTSVDNDVADLISRGDIAEALRFPRDCELACIQLPVPSQYRELPQL